MVDPPPAMVRVEDAVLRAADVSHMKWNRGYSYTKFGITMRDGAVYEVEDGNDSAYAAERALLAAIDQAEVRGQQDGVLA